MPQCICVASTKKKKKLKAVKLFMHLNITQHFLKREKYVWPLNRRKMDRLHLIEAGLLTEAWLS